MMKKLLVLALVLGVASLSSAALTWTVTGSTAAPGFVNQGDNLVLSLSTDNGATGVIIDLITDGGALGNMTSVSTPFGSGADGLDAAAFDDLLAGNGMDKLGLAAGDWAQVNNFGTTPIVGEILSIKYTVGADEGVVVISTSGLGVLGGSNLVSIPGGNMVPPALSLEVIPEPATLALLGLGALVLRRKK